MNPNEMLVTLMKNYPKTGHFVDDFRSARGLNLPEWPNWCFLPMAAWYAIVSEQHKLEQLGLDQVGDVSILAALATWRYSQGIYQINGDMLEALSGSIIFGDLPADVFQRLPEWCIYVDTPGLTWANFEISGFWAHLEWDANDGHQELRLLINPVDGSPLPVPVHIGKWTVSEAVNKYIAEAKKQASIHNFPLIGVDNEENIRILTEQVSKLVSILLYICSDAPDINDVREPGKSATRPSPTKTKKGLRLFPATHPRIWSVGENVGEKLRVYRLAGGNNQQKSKRAHLRRGHWHGYWTGPRSGDQKFVYRWIHPLIAGGGQVEEE